MSPFRTLIGLLLASLLAGGGHGRADASPGVDPLPTPLATRKPLVIHMQVEGMIDGGLAAFVERAMALAEEERADAFLVEMNTYGGRVDAADEIRTTLLNAKMLTITFIHTNAASAGALIAMATDSIAMAPGSAIGAATPAY